MKNADLRKHSFRHDKQFQHDFAQLLEPELLQWLEQLECGGPIEWNGTFSRNAAAQCRESGWTQVRIVVPGCRVMHELTDQGRAVLESQRQARRKLEP
jgi:hypothetical protein